MADKKWSQFPSATPENDDAVVGLHAGGNVRFTVANFVLAVRQGLANLFVPQTRTVNNKALNNDISLNASDVGAQPTITASGILKGDGQGGVSAATPGTDYQAPLTFDNTPTENSTNPVKSGGVYTDVRTRVPNYGKGVNLLRNWYFVGGGTGRGVFPVNQRENVTLTVSNATRYFVDGWRANGTFTLSLSANGLTIAATGQVYFQQFLSDILPWGKSITASMLTTDGITTFSGNLPASKPAASTVILSSTDGKGRFALINDAANMLNLQIRTDSATRTVIAVKLELGTEQTLCHNEGTAEAPVWVLNDIPDYEYEFYRCITSTADPSDIYANKVISTNVSKPNLLRNWYFVGGGTGRGVFPVNQRGVTSGTTTNNAYSIDAWKWTYTTRAGSWVLNSTGLVLTPDSASDTVQMFEYLENTSELNGKSITASILRSDGTLKYGTITRNSSITQFIVDESDVGLRIFADGNFRIYARITQTIVAVKLELGTEQTLAHQENGVWVLNEIPDYEYEFYRCMTSTADSTDTYANKSLATRQDLTSIQATGTTNTTGAAIPAGAYFYLNGVLHRAKTQIDKNATFTVNTNCEPATVGAELQKTVFDKQTTNGTFYDILPGWGSKALDNVVANISNYQSGVYNVSSSGGPDFIVVLGKLNNSYYSGLIFNYNSSFFGLFQYFNGQKTLKQIAQI